ncbi:class V aminotransferase [Sphingomonas profundi]|uniref:class V aminotransferase n=1 Tax=Alterirhizorhabdus profundi TaxID=2681549 RepID=UPI0012E7046B|nr:class V aminotransferase [Sphingomonas profundi]
MSTGGGYRHLFQRAIAAAPDRVHLAAHSHPLWPDASFVGQIAAWSDAARLAGDKWSRVLDEIRPGAQAHVAAELNLPDAATVAFAGNAHELLLRLVSAIDRRPVRILTSDGEFASFARQAARWAESGRAIVEAVAMEPRATFADRFVTRARAGGFDLAYVSQVMFGSGLVFDRIADLAALARPEGPWVAIDGYHGFMAIETDLSAVADRVFYIAGGYKYAMAGEGAGLMHAPPGYGPRPEETGWFADASERGTVGYPADARRFMGSTFDPSGLYRFVAVRDMLAGERLTTTAISAHVAALHARLLDGIGGTPLAAADLLNPPGAGARARFLAFRSPQAAAWAAAFAAEEVVVHARDDLLRVCPGLNNDERDVDRFLAVARALPGTTAPG